MAMINDMVRNVPAWSTAVLATSAMASMVQTWQLQVQLIDAGALLPSTTAIEAALRDGTSMLLPMCALFAVALPAIVLIASRLRPHLRLPAMLAWPVAGGSIIASILLFLHAPRVLPQPGAGDVATMLLLCLAGAIGGFVFGWLRPSRDFP